MRRAESLVVYGVIVLSSLAGLVALGVWKVRESAPVVDVGSDEVPAWRMVTVERPLVNMTPDESECVDVVQIEGSREVETVLSVHVPKPVPEVVEQSFEEQMENWRQEESSRLSRIEIGNGRRWNGPKFKMPQRVPSPEEVRMELKRREQNAIEARVKEESARDAERKKIEADAARLERRRKAIEEIKRRQKLGEF